MSFDHSFHKLKCDLLVVGSGAAGLTAAITAATEGLEVIVAEKSEFIGGATAWSGGWVWMPRPMAPAKGGDALATGEYLENVLGKDADKSRIDTFVRNASTVQEFLLQKTPVRFIEDVTIPDYHSHCSGFAKAGRSRVVAPFNGRLLGPYLDYLRKPLPVLTIAGLMPSAGPEIKHFFNATRSFRSCLYVAQRFLSHAIYRIVSGRNPKLTNGTALAGGLLKSA
ncbi:MAG: FAD-dependent oxidoreductase, partial [Sneathiellales bacterium]|nr:FAD-dependent oxidoreductase [Sneathiellales bacterium]